MADQDGAATPSGDLLTPGSLVGNRFRIIREVGHGGMGIVYEATDQVLERRVALKCAKAGHQNRLPPEARAAREVSHFHVCKVHDVHTVGTAAGDVEFLSMEFVEGETLSDRIRRDGPLPPDEARAIATQICAGLAQAHRQGVVHGDLKCGNVLLAPTPDGVRAVITDFGLARVTLGGPVDWESLGGTFEYMAPELFRGERTTIASDLYALGVLFHVMLTGQPPQRCSTESAPPPEPVREASSNASRRTVGSTKTAGQRIAAGDWEREITNLAAPWKKVVTRCLAVQPERRFASTEQVANALEPRRLILKSTGAVVVTASLAFGYWTWPVSPVDTPVRLAILPFTVEGNVSVMAAGIGNDLAERLSGARRNFVVIPPRENQTQRVDTPEKARSIVGATHALQTQLRASGALVAAKASLVDLASGQRIGQPLDGTYSVTDSAALAKALIATVTRAFRLRSQVPMESVAPPAYADYSQGIDLLRQDSANAEKAIPLLERAIALDPRSALPYAGLAEAELFRFQRGEGAEWLDRATRNVAKAKSLNGDSVPVLLASGLAEQQRGQYERAVRDFTRATELNPGSSDGWRRLAFVYERTNRPEEAIATYRKAIDAQPDYYRTYQFFGTFYLTRGEFSQAEQLYRRVTTIAPDLAAGHMNLGAALIRLGRFADAEVSLNRALRLRRTPVLLSNLGSLYYLQERYAEAAPLYKECAEAQPSSLRYRNLGDSYRHLGRKNDAVQAYEQGRRLAEQDLVRNPRQASSRLRLALLSAYLGDNRRAESELSQALSLEPENVDVLREGVITYEVLGQRGKTLDLLQNASAALLEELNRWPDLKSLQKDPAFQDLLRRRAKQ